MRRNAGVGGVYEAETLTRLGLTKNTMSYPPGGDPEFIPDAVLSDNPPRFTEIKNYESTTLYRGSNAARQVEYLDTWARAHPDGPRPTFDLWISNDSNISQTFADLLTDASEQVDITVNGQPWLP